MSTTQHADARRPQYMSALQRANAIRLGASALKREIAAGELTIEQALDDERAGSLTVAGLLACQHRWGATRTREVLNRLGIPELKRVRDLTDRRRKMIAAVTSSRADVQTAKSRAGDVRWRFDHAA